MPIRVTCVLLAVLWCCSCTYQQSKAGVLDGIGILSDSTADEYQFEVEGDFKRDTARSWVEQLAESRQLNFGEFSTEQRTDSRRQGYAYNWARGGAWATDDRANWDLPSQLPGLLEQVNNGDVTSTTTHFRNCRGATSR